jgi:hypothetical protein
MVPVAVVGLVLAWPLPLLQKAAEEGVVVRLSTTPSLLLMLVPR